MSSSLVMRAILAATALSVAPAIASAQAPQTKPCKDGTSSSRSTFACWGHGGVDTTHAAAKHQAAEPVQAGEPRAEHAKSTAHKKAKAPVHHAKVEHHEARAAKKKHDEARRGWLPWRHKKEKEQDAKKTTKHKSSSRLPFTERPNGQPRQP
jgi:hypothetical protein